MRLAGLLLGVVLAVPCAAQDAGFVTDGVTAAFFHELGHALIDVLRVRPAREEDAADELSILLIDRLTAEPQTGRLAAAAARVFELYAQESTGGGSSPHSPDADRAQRLACLYRGSRGETGCAAEWQAVVRRWQPLLEGRPPQDGGRGLRLVVPGDRDAQTRAVAAMVAAFNAEFGLPLRIDVTVEPCGRPDAFYDPRARRIVICDEYAGEMARLGAAVEGR